MFSPVFYTSIHLAGHLSQFEAFWIVLHEQVPRYHTDFPIHARFFVSQIQLDGVVWMLENLVLFEDLIVSSKDTRLVYIYFLA